MWLKFAVSNTQMTNNALCEAV